MEESIFLNKNEMVSFYWVDVEIGREPGPFFTPCNQERGQDQILLTSERGHGIRVAFTHRSVQNEEK
jgi:hypothetical protein